MALNDPIVDEIHRVREKIMEEHDNDLHKLFEHLREQQKRSGRKYVTRSPRRAEPDSRRTAI